LHPPGRGSEASVGDWFEPGFLLSTSLRERDGRRNLKDCGYITALVRADCRNELFPSLSEDPSILPILPALDESAANGLREAFSPLRARSRARAMGKTEDVRRRQPRVLRGAPLHRCHPSGIPVSAGARRVRLVFAGVRATHGHRFKAGPYDWARVLNRRAQRSRRDRVPLLHDWRRGEELQSGRLWRAGDYRDAVEAFAGGRGLGVGDGGG
jgi:hypothetical protein